MNTLLVICGALTVLTAVVHSIVGEKMLIGPLQQTQDLPLIRGSDTPAKQTLRFAWHVTSVLGLGIAAVFFYFAQHPIPTPEQSIILHIFAATNLLSFAVALIGSRGRHPSWIVFLLIGIFSWLATQQ